MAKNTLKLTDASGQELVQGVPQVTGARPVGTQVHIEMLTPNEILGTNLHLAGSAGPTLNGAPQGYVLAVGPMVHESYGIKVGDRVVVSGTFTPLPEACSQNGRPQGMLEPHTIKAILIEQK